MTERDNPNDQNPVLNVAIDYSEPAIHIDLAELLFREREGQHPPRNLQLVGIQVKPIPEPDGSHAGYAVGRWVISAPRARWLAERILSVLDEKTSEANGEAQDED